MQRVDRRDSLLNAAYLAAIVDSSDDAIIGKTLAGTIQSWNPSAASMFGYSADEIIGQPVQVLFPPDRLDEESRIIEHIRRGTRVDHFETVRRRKDGSEFPVSVTISPIRDAQGVIVGASKILRDISERRRTELALEQARVDLERVVVERTRALADRDLLLREVYHRVKNNLQVVDSLLLIKALKITDPAARAALMELRSRVFALGLVHQQLMTSSDLQTFDIGPFLNELSANLMDGAANDRIRLTVEACPLHVGMDVAAPLGLLVTELLTNSLRHAFSDMGGQIMVTLQTDEAGGMTLTVSDNGRGQANLSQKPAAPGSGSSIINKLVAQLAGEMTVRHGPGTTTEIFVPLMESS